MTVVLVQQGQKALLEETWNTTVASTFRLFSNDNYSGQTAAQLRALTESSFTEPTFIGYQAVAVTSWTISGGGPSYATHDEITFSCVTAPSTLDIVHGYWLERDSDGKLMLFEVFPTGPFRIHAAANAMVFQPVLALD